MTMYTGVTFFLEWTQWMFNRACIPNSNVRHKSLKTKLHLQYERSPDNFILTAL